MIWGWEGEGRTVEESFGSGTPIYRIRYLTSVELGLLVGWLAMLSQPVECRRMIQHQMTVPQFAVNPIRAETHS